ncbi:hypothetical protein [Segniliparus rotundus]|uniref:hypothetical protein n=1 Tax=Segniliparus rotundus TaxID=286802 RepID=UPI0016511DDC|nr:hypothetical protein [Segniliparus rotundus]
MSTKAAALRATAAAAHHGLLVLAAIPNATNASRASGATAMSSLFNYPFCWG